MFVGIENKLHPYVSEYTRIFLDKLQVKFDLIAYSHTYIVFELEK